MPFTGAHPAIILPFTRTKQLSVTGLVVGSIAPDFEYFFQMKEVGNIGHKWYGIIQFDLPAALIFCYAFHLLIRDLLITHFPIFLKVKCVHVYGMNWHKYFVNNIGKVMMSLLIGISTHLFWDSFTHHDGLFVMLFPILQQPIKLSFTDLPLYAFLQVAFSIVGLWVMYTAIQRTPSVSVEKQAGNSRKYFWPKLTLVVTTIALCRLIFWRQYNSSGGIAIGIMGSITYGLLLVAMGYKIISLKK